MTLNIEPNSNSRGSSMDLPVLDGMAATKVERSELIKEVFERPESVSAAGTPFELPAADARAHSE